MTPATFDLSPAGAELFTVAKAGVYAFWAALLPEGNARVTLSTRSVPSGPHDGVSLPVRILDWQGAPAATPGAPLLLELRAGERVYARAWSPFDPPTHPGVPASLCVAVRAYR